MDLEIIEGREYRKLNLGNGDTVYFINELKGREYRAMRQAAASAVKVTNKDVQPSLDPNAQPEEKKAEFNLGEYYENMFVTFPVLCKVKRKDSELIEAATLEYFDNLSFEDADLVSNELMSENAKQKKTQI